ncbi:MAG: diguanylate cyclase [Anaerolineales bacterium]|nr:diguanylate cyclase [Anaerolineales bacterium]
MDPFYLLVVIISYTVLNAVCLAVIFTLWLRSRNRFSGTGFWLGSYFLEFIGAFLILFRDRLPEAVPVIAGNGLLIACGVFLFIGLEQFVGKPGPQWQNALLFAAFLSTHAFFFFGNPSLAARNINVSIASLAVCGQCAWLVFRRADPSMRPLGWGAGLVFLGFCLTALVRIAVNLLLPVGEYFFRSNDLDLTALIVYQMLFVALTFTLSLMVNLRLSADLERDILIRRQVEQALRESEEKFSNAFRFSPSAIVISGARDGRLLDVNDSFCKLSGYAREEALSSLLLPRSLWADPRDEEECFTLLQKNRRVRNLEYNFRTKERGVRQCLYSGEIILLAGEPYILSVVSDITERKRVEQDLRRSEANFREVFESSAQGLFILDVLEDGGIRIRESNFAMEKMTGAPRESHDGISLVQAFPEKTAAEMLASCRRCLEEGKPITLEQGFDLPAGRKFVHTTLSPVREESGRIYRIIGSALDISERKWSEETLRLRINLWEYSIDHTVEALMQKALDEIEAITGSSISYYHFLAEDETTPSWQAWSTRTRREACRAQGGGRHFPLERAGAWADCLRNRTPVIYNDFESLPDRKGMPDGHPPIVRELAVPTFHGGRIVSVLGIGNKPVPYTASDAELLSSLADIVWVIVDHKRTEEEIQRLKTQLEEMAVHDSLTGLYNRHYLEATLRRELAVAAREKYPVSFVMIDIDCFKGVNDAFGHKAGDAVLQNLAALLTENSRASDIIFRFGGEEFLAILPKVRVELAHQIAEKWRRNFLETTVLLGYGGVKATISCGVAAYPRHATAGADLIACADQAMYQAKASGRNRSAIWKPPRKKRGNLSKE